MVIVTRWEETGNPFRFLCCNLNHIFPRYICPHRRLRRPTHSSAASLQRDYWCSFRHGSKWWLWPPFLCFKKCSNHKWPWIAQRTVHLLKLGFNPWDSNDVTPPITRRWPKFREYARMSDVSNSDSALSSTDGCHEVLESQDDVDY